MIQRVGVIEKLKVLFWALRVVTIVVGSLGPARQAGTMVGAVFFVVTVIGGVIGWRWGRAEGYEGKTGAAAVRLLAYGVAFFCLYVVFTWTFPRLGLVAPTLYEDDLFVPMTVLRAIPWAAAIGTIVRLIALLERTTETGRVRRARRGRAGA